MAAPPRPGLCGQVAAPTCYGTVRTLAGAPSAPGSVVHGLVNSQTWGTVRTFQFGADTVYVLDVAGDDPNTPKLEGARPGEQVNFRVDGVTVQATAGWQPATVTNVDLLVASVYKTVLPAVQR